MDENPTLKALSFTSHCFIPSEGGKNEKRHSHCHPCTMLPYPTLQETQHLSTSHTPRSFLSASTQAHTQINGNTRNQILLSLKEHQNF